jgi:PsbN protein
MRISTKVVILRYIIGAKVVIIFTPMEPAIALNISIGVVLVALTGYAIFTAFGPPGKALRDPFEEHED